VAKDRANIRIYGDDASGVWVAPKGTTGPTTLAAPGVGFAEVGWLSEDGIDLDRDQNIAEFNAWQGGTLVRSKKTSVKDTFKFVCLEETAATLGLYYAGVTPTTATGVDTFAITNQTASDERAWVADMVDGTITKRLVVPSGEITGVATIGHKNSDMTMYEFTVTIYGDYDILKTAAA
jgi:hypothetical protein